LPHASPQSTTSVILKALPVAVLSGIACIWALQWRAKTSGDRRIQSLFGIVCLLVFDLLFSLPFTAYEVYPRIPVQFGGGRSYRARIAIAGDSENQLASLGIICSPESKLSYPLTILHDGESFLVLRINN
jgi:hypothetical protein